MKPDFWWWTKFLILSISTVILLVMLLRGIDATPPGPSIERLPIERSL